MFGGFQTVSKFTCEESVEEFGEGISSGSFELFFIAHGLEGVVCVAILLEICPGVNARGEDDKSWMNRGKRGRFPK